MNKNETLQIENNFENNEQVSIAIRVNNLLSKLLAISDNDVSIQFENDSKAILYVNEEKFYLDFNSIDLVESYSRMADTLFFNGKVIGRLKLSSKEMKLDSNYPISKQTNNNLTRNSVISVISIKETISLDEINTTKPKSAETSSIVQVQPNLMTSNKKLKISKAKSIIPWVYLPDIPITLNYNHISDFFNSLSIKNIYCYCKNFSEDFNLLKSYDIYVEFTSNYGADLAIIRSDEEISNYKVTVTEVDYIEACIVKAHGIVLTTDTSNFIEYLKEYINIIPKQYIFINIKTLVNELKNKLKTLIHPCMIRSYEEQYNIKAIKTILSQDPNMKNSIELYNQIIIYDDHVSLSDIDYSCEYWNDLVEYKLLFFNIIENINDYNNINIIKQSTINQMSRIISLYEFIIAFSRNSSKFY